MKKYIKRLIRYSVNPFQGRGFMKRNVILLTLAVVLSISLGVGVVYAYGGHNPAQGSKLLGVGQLGKLDVAYGYQQTTTEFQFTNTDCNKEITIEQVSIIASDGTVIYEGSFISVDGDSRVEVLTLSPHEIGVINLAEYIYLGGDILDPGSWMASQDAISQDLDSYTVEIDWDAKGQVDSPAGWITVYRTTMEGSTKYRAMSQSQMVNLGGGGDQD